MADVALSEDEKKIMATLLGNARVQTGYSQNELAVAANCSLSQIRTAETTMIRDDEALVRILTALMARLVSDGAGGREDMEMIRAYRGLNSDSRQALRAFLRTLPEKGE